MTKVKFQLKSTHQYSCYQSFFFSRATQRSEMLNNKVESQRYFLRGLIGAAAMLDGLFVSIMTFLMSSLRPLHRCLNNSLRNYIMSILWTEAYITPLP